MIKKYVFGAPFNTEAAVENIEASQGNMPYFSVTAGEQLILKYEMDERTSIYGLGENVRGINKRGNIYESFCSDDFAHTEDKRSLYGAHNFFIVDGEERFGVFVDYPANVIFDFGYEKVNEIVISAMTSDANVYIVEADGLNEIVREFRQLIGMSYIPPKWAFGFTQSRWGYACRQDIDDVIENYEKCNIPLDAVYMDIDYMDHYKDFTVDEAKFPHFNDYVKEVKNKGIRLVPIIDAGVKIEKGYDIYEEGVKNNYFCKDENGTDYVTAVWPGLTYFPDFLNADARKWFGDKYKTLIDAGIEGFWNDMNEPAIFYSQNGLDEIWDRIEKLDMKSKDIDELMSVRGLFDGLQNSSKDYSSFYHNVNGKKIRHDKVHNLYGYNMTRAAGEAFDRIDSEKRYLMFSRSSYIGMHRYGGIWMGDNYSWWSHILLNLQMLPSLNMCGFLYTGADLGGFGSNASRELVLRWLELGVFTPLLRNHSAAGTRVQECYRFENTDEFKDIINLRYSLIPYLYSEYMKAALCDEMMFKPLAFVYENDDRAKMVEDQLMIGEDIMIAPVYTQNARGRYVYVPEEMMCVTFPERACKIYKKGNYFVDIEPHQVVVFIKKNHMIPLCAPAKNTESLNEKELSMLGYIDGHAEYVLYTDDGFSKDYENQDNYITITADINMDGIADIFCERDDYDIERADLDD